VVDVLVTKALQAAKGTGARSVLLGGGVSCNQALRERMSRQAERERLSLYYPHPELCLDNAAMVAGLGGELFSRGRLAPPELAALPQLQALG
jgi:N6-L-threonylcarbamoyladenine synthase